MSTYTRGTDLVSAIICGEVNEGGERQFVKYVPFFKDNVEVFFAEADPTKAPLFRTSLLAKHLKCNSSRIGMWLHRRKDSCDGIYQASTYLNRPAAASGLRIGAYFISLKLCEEIAEFMCKTEEKKVTRAEDTKQILPDTSYLPTIQSSSNPQAAPVFFFNPALPNGGVYHPNPSIGHTFVPNNGFYPAHPAQFQMGSFPAAYFTPQGQIAMPAQMQIVPSSGMVMQQTAGGTISAPVSSVTPGGGVSTDVSMSVASSPSIPSSQQGAPSNVSMMFVPGTDAALIALPTGTLPVQGFQYPNYQQQ